MSDSLEYYTKDAPSNQAMLDIFKGEWSSKMPAASGLSTSPGSAALFEDPRIAWAEETLGGFEGKAILELGPLEGGHSYMMHERGASKITAVEANNRALQKCLIVKQIFNLERLELLFGDFNKFLEKNEKKFDVVIASGVLYHMVDPIKTLEMISATSSNIMMWTHYFDQKLIVTPELMRLFGLPETHQHKGAEISLVKRNYLEALNWRGFCGGAESYSYWLTRDSLLGLLKHLGFTRIEIAFDEPNHPNGPALAICATR